VVVVLIVTGAVLVAAAAYLLWRGRRPAESVVHYFRCPACGQKLRYAACKAGRPAVCPRCRRQGTLPATPRPLTAPLFAGRPNGPGHGVVRRQTA
jgi:hypothetical protein